MLMDCNNTQKHVAEWLQQKLGLDDNRCASVHRVVQMIAAKDLPLEKKEERFLHAQRTNAAKAQQAEFDRSAAGKKGAATRLRQIQQTGVSPSGHPIWDDTAKQDLIALLQDSSLRHANGRFKGRPIFSEIAEQFQQRYPNLNRTIASIRKQARLLFEAEIKPTTA